MSLIPLSALGAEFALPLRNREAPVSISLVRSMDSLVKPMFRALCPGIARFLADCCFDQLDTSPAATKTLDIRYFEVLSDHFRFAIVENTSS